MMPAHPWGAGRDVHAGLAMSVQRRELQAAMTTLIHSVFILFAALGLAGPANPFFAMDTIARGRPDVVVPMLKELGYDGLGGAAGDEAMAKALETNGLKFFNGYLTLSLDEDHSTLDDRLKGVMDRMQGHNAALWLAVQKVLSNEKPFAKSSPAADGIAVMRLGEIADYAKTRGVKVALYPHTGFWIERVEDAIRIADKLNCHDVGVTFNLCHWLKVEGSGRDPLPVLKAIMPRLMFVTINGADTGDTESMAWNRLIQPLGSGSYDAAAFMKKVWAAGYTGPVGFQGFGIAQDPKAVLANTMVAWREINDRRR